MHVLAQIPELFSDSASTPDAEDAWNKTNGQGVVELGTFAQALEEADLNDEHENEESSDKELIPSWKPRTIAYVRLTIGFGLNRHEIKFLEQKVSKIINKKAGSTVEPQIAGVLQDAAIEVETEAGKVIYCLI